MHAPIMRSPTGSGFAFTTHFGWIEPEIVEVALVKHALEKFRKLAPSAPQDVHVVITHPGFCVDVITQLRTLTVKDKLQNGLAWLLERPQ